MADAKQCDRCGKLYLSYERTDKETISGRKIKYKGSIRVDQIIGGHEITWMNYDLCPECFGELAELLRIELVKTDEA